MCKKRNRLFHFNAPVFIFPLAVACHGGGVTAATFFKMASDAGIDLQEYARGKNREIWNRGGTAASAATAAQPQSCEKYNILDNSLIINNSIKSRNDCGSCGSCGSEEDSTTSENFGTVSFQTTFSEKTGQNVLCRFLKCKE